MGGISPEDAVGAIISGFCREVFNELPLEFASEVNQLMSLKLEGSVGRGRAGRDFSASSVQVGWGGIFRARWRRPRLARAGRCPTTNTCRYPAVCYPRPSK